MEVLIYLISLLTIVSLLLYSYIKRSYSYWRSYGVPYNEPQFPYGNIAGLGKSLTFVEFTNSFYTQFKNTSPLCGLYFFTRPIAILFDLDLIKAVLVKDFATFNDRNFYYNDKNDPLSAHLVFLDAEKWKPLRQKLTPTFSSGKMKYMFPTIAKLGEHLNDYMSEIIQHNDQLEIKSIMARFTMDVIGTCAFGIECNTLKDIDSDFYRYGTMAMTKPRHDPRINFLLTDWKRTARFFGIKMIRDEVSSFFMNVIRSTIDYRETNKIRRNDFMDLLIQMKTDDVDIDESKNGSQLTVNQIAAQAFLFFAAGYETSSTTMLFILYELALNQDIQTKLRDEIEKTMKKHEELTYEMMMDIPYLDQVINETLRKYPPFIALRRQAQANYRVPNTQIVIEKGVSVVIPVYSIQHDDSIFPDPEKFDPDRFTTEEIKKRHPMAWLAFGEGPRNCIGLRFGMMQTRIGIISLISRFRFLPCSQTPIPISFGLSPVVLSPKDNVYLKIEAV